MNLAIIKRKGLNRPVWLSDILRIDPWDGLLADPNEHLWWGEEIRNGYVVLNNYSTGHRVELDARNIKQFDEAAPGMPDGAMGVFVLRSPVVLSGCNAFKSIKEYFEARKTRPQIFLPVSTLHS